MLLREILEFAARRTPHGDAVVFADGRRLDFAALEARSLGLARGLAARGRPGDHVAILAANCPEYVECYYGVPTARQRLVFLNYRLAAPEIARILEDSEAKVLIHTAEFTALADAALAELGEPLRRYVVGGGEHASYEELVEAPGPAPFAGEDAEHDVAWLIYTSGTTGMPKGAMLTHRNLLFAVLNAQAAFASEVPEPRYLFPFPMCHIAGYAILTQHLRGVPVVLQRQFDPEGWLRAVAEHRITASSLAPTMISLILEHPAVDAWDTSSLDSVGYGASSIPVEVLRRAMDRFGNVFAQGFGMTELAGNVAFLDRATHARALAGEPQLLAAAGRPGPLASVRVVDDAMRDCPPGTPGEIVVKGDQVLSGYWRRPDAEAEAFQDGWFHTGDVGRFDEEGFLYVVDRKKDMIVSGGENVYPREVEDALYAHAGVREAAVFGTPDPHWGEVVTAAIVPRDGAALDAAAVEAHVRGRLAGYKVPRRIRFVESIPKNVSGKVLKRTLREAFSPEG
jgi:acyl-CoA synthetase (AMP-forming)/AMP-acid ligase II